MPGQQLFAVDRHTVGNADEADIAAGPRRAQRLLHGLFGAHALQHSADADTAGQLLDAGDAVVAAPGDDVGGTELAGRILPGLVPGHGDDAAGAQPMTRLRPPRRGPKSSSPDRIQPTANGDGSNPARTQHYRCSRVVEWILPIAHDRPPFDTLRCRYALRANRRIGSPAETWCRYRCSTAHFPAHRVVADKRRGFPPLTPAVRSPSGRRTGILTKGAPCRLATPTPEPHSARPSRREVPVPNAGRAAEAASRYGGGAIWPGGGGRSPHGPVVRHPWHCPALQQGGPVGGT